MSTRRLSREDEISFLAKAKDGVYKASEIVREDATAVEHMAHRVEKLSKTVEDDVDHVEALVHQVITATNSMDEERDEEGVKSSGSSSKALGDEMGKIMAKDSIAVDWSGNAVHVVFILLTVSAVLLHKWGTSILNKNAVELNDSTTLPTSNNLTFFSILAVYMGTMWRVLKYMRNAMNWKKSKVIKVEEKVHEIGKEVKTIANNIEGVAHKVEHISKQIEEEATQVQSLINPEKSTSSIKA